MKKTPVAIRVYVGAIVSLAALVVGLASFVAPVSLSSVSWGALFGFFALGFGLELAEHRLAMGAGGSMAFIVYMGAAVAFGPVPTAVITASSIAGARALNGRPAIKTVFNVSQTVLGITAGALVYLALGGGIRPETLDATLLPYSGMVVVYFVINSCAVSGVLALSEGRSFIDIWIGNTWSLLGYDFVASSFGLGIAFLYVNWQMKGFLGVVVPIVFLRHTYLVNLRLQATNREMLDLMVKAIEARDPYTSGHSQRVAEMAKTIARELGLGFREVENIRTAALLHDVGKIHEEFAPILRKPGKLTMDEKMLMQSHPDRGAELVHTISSLQGAVEEMVQCHHENYDGSGYPSGLAQQDIPLGSRIIMVADTTDAMTTDRPYRRALPFDNVVAELDKYAGSQFDPTVVDAFKRNTIIRRLVASRVVSQRRALDEESRTRLQLSAH